MNGILNKMNDSQIVSSVLDVNWNTWEPKERAVLCFIRQNDKLLLIHKKTGLGKGKINAPGGRIEKGETTEAAAVRETQEEVGLTPYNLIYRGELHFIFIDGYSLHGTVFFADQYSGIPIETREALPFWCDIDKIPYDNMWEDDLYWLPILLGGQKMKGYFIFDGEKMLSKKVDIV
jgi:8-oxo-dGTP diphosphatase